MTRLTDLADVLRHAGLVVVEHPGWTHRGADLPAMPDTILCHHTATSARTAGDLPTLRLLVEGRPAPNRLPGPLSQLALSRSGVVHVLAAGKANHAGAGAWRGQTSSARTIGIEAEHPGGYAGWPRAQLDAYVALCAALCRYLQVGPERVCGHKEWALPRGRKPDPNLDMDVFRQQVRIALTSRPTPPTPTPTSEDPMSFVCDDGVKTYLRDGGDTIHIPAQKDVDALLALGAKDGRGKLSPEMVRRLVEAAKQ